MKDLLELRGIISPYGFISVDESDGYYYPLTLPDPMVIETNKSKAK